MSTVPTPTPPNRQPPKVENTPLDPLAWRQVMEKFAAQKDEVAVKSAITIIAGLETYQAVRQDCKQRGVKAPEFSRNAENAFIRLSRGINNFVIFKEIGLYYMRDLELPAVAVNHFERALKLGGAEKDLGPLIDVATVTSQRQIQTSGTRPPPPKNTGAVQPASGVQPGPAPRVASGKVRPRTAALLGITEGQRRRPDLQQIMSTTGKIVLPPSRSPKDSQQAMAMGVQQPDEAEYDQDEEDDDDDLTSADELMERARELIAAKSLNEALNCMKRANATADKGNRTPKWEVWSALGQAFYKEQQFFEAEECYAQACTFRPDYMSSHFNLALALQMNGKFLEAVTSYNQADQIEANNPRVWCNMGAVYFQMSEYRRAEMALRKTLQIKPDYGRAWDNLAACLGALGQSKDATLACREAIKYRPDSPETWFKFGALSYSESLYVEAIDAFNRSKGDKTLGPQSYAYLSLCYSAIERSTEAEDAIRKCTAVDPKCPLLWMAWNALGLCLYDAQKLDQAVRAYTAATACQPSEPEVWFNLGLAHNALQNLDQAYRCYAKALELNPEDVASWHNVGVIYAEMDQHDDAIGAFERELQLQPDSLRGWYHIGLSLQKLGREEESAAAMTKARDLQAAQQQALSSDRSNP